ncbi:hypothetical protein [Bacteroides uniformis]|uniref:hypothetical protein n=1 Tax=Bacteroides uniformis TaxID=820 RepID=UPI0032BFA6CB
MRIIYLPNIVKVQFINKHNYRINKDEWNEVNATLIISNNERNVYLQSIKERIDWGLKRLGYIIGH